MFTIRKVFCIYFFIYIYAGEFLSDRKHRHLFLKKNKQKITRILVGSHGKMSRRIASLSRTGRWHTELLYLKHRWVHGAVQKKN